MEWLTWQSVVLILCILGIFVFRAPLSYLIYRTRRISKSGLEIDLPSQSSTDLPSHSSAVTTKFAVKEQSPTTEELRQWFPSALIAEREQRLREQVQQQNFKDANERERYLILYLAASMQILHFQVVYVEIFGSQLELLQSLNPLGDAGAPIAHLEPLFKGAVTQYPDVYKDAPLEKWLEFLFRQQPIIRRETNVSISSVGREFLKYVIETGQSFQKIG